MAESHTIQVSTQSPREERDNLFFDQTKLSYMQQLSGATQRDTANPPAILPVRIFYYTTNPTPAELLHTGQVGTQSPREDQNPPQPPKQPPVRKPHIQRPLTAEMVEQLRNIASLTGGKHNGSQSFKDWEHLIRKYIHETQLSQLSELEKNINNSYKKALREWNAGHVNQRETPVLAQEKRHPQQPPAHYQPPLVISPRPTNPLPSQNSTTISNSAGGTRSTSMPSQAPATQTPSLKIDQNLDLLHDLLQSVLTPNPTLTEKQREKKKEIFALMQQLLVEMRPPS
jgi:hypothetical protein